MIVGNGSLREELKKYAVSKQLDQYIIFTGEIDNPNDYLSAFDMFIMPSLYEGLPVTLVEAQAAGLKCIVANNITREVNITGNIEYLSINKDSISLWANHVVKSNDRVNNGKKLIGSFFDISKSADYLEKKILEVIN